MAWSAVILFIAYGVEYSVGILLAAMKENLSWNRSRVFLAFTLHVITYTTTSTVTGRFIDRWGGVRESYW